MKPLTRKDLMIGDFLRYRQDFPNTHLQGRIVEIECIRGRLDVVTIDDDIVHEYVHPNWLEPIPLIPEILEKNGWKNISDHTLKGCETFRLHIEQGSFDYTLTLKLRDYFRFESYDDRVYTLCEVNFGFKYVHELQHALRLCGITKEIEL